jgi:hypothetical protein
LTWLRLPVRGVICKGRLVRRPEDPRRHAALGLLLAGDRSRLPFRRLKPPEPSAAGPMQDRLGLLRTTHLARRCEAVASRGQPAARVAAG